MTQVVKILLDADTTSELACMGDNFGHTCLHYLSIVEGQDEEVARVVTQLHIKVSGFLFLHRFHGMTLHLHASLAAGMFYT
jgi:hypothetical protein